LYGAKKAVDFYESYEKDIWRGDPHGEGFR